WRHAEHAADRAARSGDVATATRVLLPLLGDETLPPADVDRLAGKLSGVVANGVEQHVPTRMLESLLTDERVSAATWGEVRLAFGLWLVRNEEQFELCKLVMKL